MDKIRSYFNREGFKKTITAILKAPLLWVFTRKEYLIYSIDIQNPRSAKRKTCALIRKAEVGDMEKFKGLLSSQKIDVFKKRIRDGIVCFVALKENRVAGYMWSATRKTMHAKDSGFIFELGEKEAYQHNSYVFSGFRKQGIFSALANELYGYLRESGINTVKRCIKFSNNPARLSAEKYGGKVSGRGSLVTFLGRKKFISKDKGVSIA